MTNREEVARRVAEKLKLVDPNKARCPANTPPQVWYAFCQTWDALISSEMRMEEQAETLEKINRIRQSIVGGQCVNWSEHIYPLVAALEEAGYKTLGYDEERKNFGTMLERTLKAEARVKELNTEVLILANLTKADFDHFHRHHIPYTGSAADPHFNTDPSPWGKHAPYIATFTGELPRAIRALRWKRFYVEVTEHQWLVTKHEEARVKELESPLKECGCDFLCDCTLSSGAVPGVGLSPGQKGEFIAESESPRPAQESAHRAAERIVRFINSTWSGIPAYVLDEEILSQIIAAELRESEAPRQVSADSPLDRAHAEDLIEELDREGLRPGIVVKHFNLWKHAELRESRQPESVPPKCFRCNDTGQICGLCGERPCICGDVNKTACVDCKGEPPEPSSSTQSDAKE